MVLPGRSRCSRGLRSVRQASDDNQLKHHEGDHQYMNELKNPILARPMDPNMLGGEIAALKSILELTANPDLELLPGQKARTSADQPIEHYTGPIAEPIPHQSAPAPSPSFPALKKPIGRCLLLSGSLGVGKDFVAEKIGAKVFGFADPMYKVASYLTGVEVTSTENKDLPGMRDLLQKIGQWGKNDVNEKYPYTPARAIFCYVVRTLGIRGVFDPEVEWANFGTDPDIWLKACEKRINAFIESQENTGRIAITNARFKNELEHFRALPEWDHWHVMCSKETHAERLAKKKLTLASKELQDVSEQLALALNRDVAKKLADRTSNNKLRVIWNDSRPCPSPRLYTTEQFLQEIAIAEAATDVSISDE